MVSTELLRGSGLAAGKFGARPSPEGLSGRGPAPPAPRALGPNGPPLRALGSFQQGGKVKTSGAYRLEKGEEVIPKRSGYREAYLARKAGPKQGGEYRAVYLARQQPAATDDGLVASLRDRVRKFVRRAREDAGALGRMANIPGQVVAGLEGKTPAEYIHAPDKP